MADETPTAAEEARAQLLKSKEAEAKAANDAKTGVGLRAFVGQTRGRNVQVITYDAFDDSKPDTLPKSLTEFMEVTKINDQKAILDFVIAGYNESQYKQASDPIAEFIDPTWDDDKKAQFRLIVRNYSKMLSTSIEDAAKFVLKSLA